MSDPERPNRLSQHASPDGIEAVAFDLLIDQGYSLDVFDHMRSHRDYVLRIRKKLDGYHNGAGLPETVYMGGQWYEVPLVWTIGNIECWCSRKNIEDLFAQIRVELGGFDPNSTLDRAGMATGPKRLTVASGTVYLTNHRWSDVLPLRRRMRLDGPAELVEAADRRQELIQQLDTAEELVRQLDP